MLEPTPDDAEEQSMIMLAQLDKWERLANEATPGPWKVDSYNRVHTENGPHGLCYIDSCEDPDPQNAAFIAEAREAIPELIREVRRLRGGVSKP